jgi:uncharacterized protein DUF4019
VRRVAASVRKWGAAQWSAAAALVGAIATVATLVSSGGDSSRKQPEGGDSSRKQPEGPVEAARESLLALFASEYGVAWQQLHPADQKLVSKARYIRCQRAAGAPANLLALRTNGTTAADPNRPGIPEGSATVVSFSARVRNPKRVVDYEAVVRLAKADERWRVLLSDSEYNAFKAGDCAYAPSKKSTQTETGPSTTGGDQLLP